MFQDRNNRHIEEQINRHNIGRKRREENRKKKQIELEDKVEDYIGQNVEEGEAVPIKSKKAQWNKQTSLEFNDDHFIYRDAVVKTCIGDFIRIDYPDECNKKQDDEDLTQNQNTVSDCSQICGTRRFENENYASSVVQKHDGVETLSLRTPKGTPSEMNEDCEYKTIMEETHKADTFPLLKNSLEENKLCDANLNTDPFDLNKSAVGEEGTCGNENLTEVVEQIEKDMSKTFIQESCIVLKNDKNIASSSYVESAVGEDKCEMISSVSAVSDAAGNCFQEAFRDENITENRNAWLTNDAVEIAVITETDGKNQLSNVSEMTKIACSSYDLAQVFY